MPDDIALARARLPEIQLRPPEVFTAMDFALAILQLTHPSAYQAAILAIEREREIQRAHARSWGVPHAEQQ